MILASWHSGKMRPSGEELRPPALSTMSRADLVASKELEMTVWSAVLGHERHRDFTLSVCQITCSGEASCHIVRMLKQPCGLYGNWWRPPTNSQLELASQPNSAESECFSPSQAFRWLQLTTASWETPKPQHPAKLFLYFWPTETVWSNKCSLFSKLPRFGIIC